MLAHHTRFLRILSVILMALLATATKGEAASIPPPFSENFSSVVSTQWDASTYREGAPGGTQFKAENANNNNHVLRDARGTYLDLILKRCPTGGSACGGEIVTKRSDFFYGRYRFVVTVPDTRSLPCPEGFVLGLFNLSRYGEIDIEFLRRTAPPNSDACFGANDQNATNKMFTPTHMAASMLAAPPETYTSIIGTSFLGVPTTYGFDWAPDKITFYVNGVERARITDRRRIPQEPARIVLNTWAGQPTWGGLAPATAIRSRIYSVSYTAAFFP